MSDTVESILRVLPLEMRAIFDTELSQLRKRISILEGQVSDFQAMFENMINGFAFHKIVTDKSGIPIDYIFLDVNNAFCRMTGLDKKDLIDKSVKEAFPGTENDPADWIGTYGKVALTGQETTFENFSAALQKWFMVRAYSPQKGYFATIFEDITQQKNSVQALADSELKYRHMISNISDVIAVIDKDGTIRYKSPNITAQFGWTPEELIGKEALISCHPDDALRIGNELVELMGKDGHKTRVEYRYLRKDGSSVPIELTAVNLLKDKAIKGILCNYKDISERRNAQQAVLESLRLGAVGEMASAVAHDFNNSLQTILGNLELAMMEPDIPEEVIGSLDLMKIAATDAATRIQMLQRFGGKKKAQSGHKPVDMNAMVRDVMEQAKPMWKSVAEKNGLDIDFITDLGDVPRTQGNGGELRSAIFNVVKNAVEAMPQGGTITIKTTSDEKTVSLTVRDTGIGMSQEVQTRIFQPFYTTKGFEEGKGLGMSGAYAIIQEHRGKIKVLESTLGSGSVVQIILPVCKNDIPLEPVRSSSFFDVPGKILWVDDDERIRKLALRLIKRLGHNAMVAQSGQEALELLKEHQFDLVITDIGMPGMSGWQLAEIINDQYDKDIKVAAITGWGFQIGDEERERYGVGYVLSKPIQLAQLDALIAEALQVTHKESQNPLCPIPL